MFFNLKNMLISLIEIACRVVLGGSAILEDPGRPSLEQIDCGRYPRVSARLGIGDVDPRRRGACWLSIRGGLPARLQAANRNDASAMAEEAAGTPGLTTRYLVKSRVRLIVDEH